MFVQLACIGGQKDEEEAVAEGKKDRMSVKILFFTPVEIEGTNLTVGPKPNLFLFQGNKRLIYPTIH